MTESQRIMKHFSSEVAENEATEEFETGGRLATKRSSAWIGKAFVCGAFVGDKQLG